MIRVLFLDDEVYRHDGACSNKHSSPIDKNLDFTVCAHKNTLVYHVWDAQQAIECLRVCNRFTVVFLDHDLGFGHNKSDHDVMNGSHVVSILCDLPEEKRPREVVIHSHNTVSSLQMEKKLEENGYDVIRQAFHPLHYHFAE